MPAFASRKIRHSLLGLLLVLGGCSQLRLPPELASQVAKYYSLGPQQTTLPAQFPECIAPLLKANGGGWLDGDYLAGMQEIFTDFNSMPGNSTVPGFTPGMFWDSVNLDPEIHAHNTDPLGNFQDILALQLGQVHTIFGRLAAHSQRHAEVFSVILKNYLKAYFGPGELLAALKAEIQKTPAPPPSDNPGGFISGGGTRYKFTGLAPAGSSVAIDHSQVGADLIRISFEALRDTYLPVPVVKTSTLATLAVSDEKFQAVLRKNGVTVDTYAGPAGVWHVGKPGGNGDTVYNYQMPASAFTDAEAQANQAESMVATAVGKAIRGGSWGSLNNEALAKAVETAAGVFARHVAERVGWCGALATAADR